MADFFQALVQHQFLSRALIVGILVSLCASLLGVSLVLKRYSMIGDGLSHVGFGALAVAAALNTVSFAVSIPVVLLAAFMLLRISENSKIKGDAAIALISSASLALGVIVVSLTTGMNTDVYNYMFGSILSISKTDAMWSVILCIAVLVLFVGFYPRIFSITFDESFAKAIGTNVGAYNLMLAFLTAITIVLGMRMMGALLISSLIIFPPLTAMRIFKTFKSVMISSAAVSLFSFFIGMVISYNWQMPSGASIVAVNAVMFVIFAAIGKIKGDLVQRGKMPKVLTRFF